MINTKRSTKKLAYLAVAIATNTLLGSIITFSGVPFLFLDSIGTIFISSHFKLKYGLLTAVGTHFLLSVIHGPLALPFMLVSLSIAVVSHFFKSFMHSYKKAILAGIFIAVVGALFSTPVRIILYGGFKGVQKSVSDLFFILLNHSGFTYFTSVYFSTFIDLVGDKVISCLLITYLTNLAPFKKYLRKLKW
ncbi:hypothetical protein [Vagococcus bubulae]|uniref:ECF transporter S component n=1 Tax=Vagococcus bubulae TaxID=1977868 RepID=A0A429ZES8_9ENTE|nr:hypothetical protein [Vagococcus bubulae]RST92208.1 hypothetical protein CBF36_08965 [Vagococcus bubulae]